MSISAAKAIAIVPLVCLAGLSFGLDFDTSPLVADLRSGTVSAAKAVTPDADMSGAEMDMSETLARPLFEPGRRPPEVQVAMTDAIEPDPVPDEVEPTPAQEAQLGLKVLGIQISPQRASALLASGPDGQARWVRKGEKIESWELVKVEKDKVTLHCEDDSLPDCERVLSLYGQPPAGDGS